MKVAVGEKVAGKFQYNRFAALMNHQDYYDKAYSATQGVDGAMDTMNDYYVDSIAGRLKSLQAAGEGLISSLFDQDAVEPMLESVTELVNNITTLTENLGGLDGVLSMVGGTFLRVFSSQIGEQVRNVATSISSITTYGKSMKDFDNSVSMLGFKDISDKNHTETSKFVTSISSRFGNLSEGSQQKIRETAQGLYDLELKRKNTSDTSADLYNKIENSLENQRSQQRKNLGVRDEKDLKKKQDNAQDELTRRERTLRTLLGNESEDSVETNLSEAKGKLDNAETTEEEQRKRIKSLQTQLEVKRKQLESNTAKYNSEKGAKKKLPEGTTVKERRNQEEEITNLQNQLDEATDEYKKDVASREQAQKEYNNAADKKFALDRAKKQRKYVDDLKGLSDTEEGFNLLNKLKGSETFNKGTLSSDDMDNLRKLQKIMLKDSDAANELRKALEELGMTERDLNMAMETANAEAKKVAFEDMVSGVTNLAGSLITLGTAFSSIDDMMDSFANNDWQAGLMTGFTILSTAIPSAIEGFQSLKDIVSSVKNLFNAAVESAEKSLEADASMAAATADNIEARASEQAANNNRDEANAALQAAAGNTAEATTSTGAAVAANLHSKAIKKV